MTDIRHYHTVVINRCYGGFGLSEEARELFIQTKRAAGHIVPDDFYEGDISRDDPFLIAAVYHLGSKASGDYSDLRVITVEVDIEIDSFDGKETVKVSGCESYR